MSSNWFVYLLRCSDNSLYTGITTNVERRVAEHNQSNTLGAKYTKARRPVTLVYVEQQKSRQSASKREYQLKQLKKSEKETLVKKSALP